MPEAVELMGSIITSVLVGLIAFLLFKQAKKHGFVLSFFVLTVCGLIAGYSLWVVGNASKTIPPQELPMYLGLGLFMSYFILGTLLFFKLVKTNRKRVLYSFALCIACIFFRIAFGITRSSLDSGLKFTAEFKFIDWSTSIVTIAAILFFLTVLVKATQNAIFNWLDTRSRLRVQTKAEAGDVEAQNNLGAMYYLGKGVEEDFKEAVKWYQKAADQGDAMAQTSCAVMYYKGEEVEQNYVTAYAWCNIAATNSGEVAKEDKSIFAKEMDPEQIAETEELVKEMIKKNPKLIIKKG